MRTSLKAALLVIAVCLVGCGGGDSEDRTDDADTATAAYIRKADGTCSRQSLKIRQRRVSYLEEQARRGVPRATIDTKVVNRVLAPALGYEIRSVRAIVLPPKDVKPVLAFLQSWQNVVYRAEKHPIAFVRSQQPFAKPERLARAFGFRVCGSL